MTAISTKGYAIAAQECITKHIDVPTQYASQHYTPIIENLLDNYTTYLEQWDFAMSLHRALFDFQKNNNTTKNVALFNSYAFLVALAPIVSALYPYLCYDKPERADHINGIEAAQLEQRIDIAKNYLKQEGVKELEIYEELTDLATYTCYGKRKFAQLLLGMTASFIIDQHLSDRQGKTICQTIISGIEDPSKYIDHIVSFSQKN